MAVKIRLQRRGRKAAPFYHVVIADARSPRDGRFIEKIGTYNPLTVPATIELNRERANYWLGVGAQPTDTVNAILRFKGVLFQKHLQKGVAKGAFDQEKADQMLADWIEQKESNVEKRRVATSDAKKKLVEKIDGVAKVKAKPVPPPPPAEEEAPAMEDAPAEDTATDATMEAAAEETPVEAVAEAPVEAAAEETVAEEAVPAVDAEAATEPAAEEAPATEEKTEE